MKTYQQKDLGYPRTPTGAVIHVEMPDRSTWAVPVQIVADSRDENYAEDKEDTIGAIRAKKLSDFAIGDWAANNMNWSDVEAYATKVKDDVSPVDFQDGWVNGSKEIEGAI